MSTGIGSRVEGDGTKHWVMSYPVMEERARQRSEGSLVLDK